VGIGLDVTLAVDTPGVGPDEAVTRMGEGIGIKVYDSSMISTRFLVDEFWDLAQDKGIPAQLEVLGQGGTDGAAIQRSREGVPTLTLSLPTRYIHTIVEAVHETDLRAGVDLLVAYLGAGEASA
jgi:endoglucanase